MGAVLAVLNATWQWMFARALPVAIAATTARLKLPVAHRHLTRKFVPCASTPPTETPFKVISYNVLGPMHGMAPKHAYTAAAQRVWTVRRPRLLAEIDFYDADIVCLQENTVGTFENDFKPHMTKAGFHCLFKHERANPRNRPEWLRNVELELEIATFVRLNRFRVVVEEMRILAKSCELLESIMKCDIPAQLRDDFVRKDQGMHICLLEDLTSKKTLLLVNIHLHYDPREMDVKALQAFACLTYINEFLREHEIDRSSLSIMICGDFNSTEKHQPEFCVLLPESAEPTVREGGVFTLFKTGSLPRSHPEHPARFRFVSDLPDLVSPVGGFAAADENTPQHHPATTKTDEFVDRIDYIWVDAKMKVQSVLELPFTRETLPAFGPVPSNVWPSDHLAIGASLTF
eukprot:m.184106 g.184106  ORF g.184106 m.184106 type:complete len:403 (-) comp53514_c0_seq1:116-1324(-)